MRTKRREKWFVAALAMVCLSVAVAAWARGPRGEPGFGGPGRGGLPGGCLLERLLDPCRGACFDTARSCGEAAETDAVSCAESTCPTEIQGAQSACETDRRSDECQTALGTLKDCLEPCLDTLHTAVTSCRDALGTCREACSATTPTPGS